MKHSVIYVPGLGDSRIRNRQLAVGTWRWYGVRPEVFQMNWSDKEPFAPKFDRLLSHIDELIQKGYDVSLVGESAGASAVINAFVRRPSVHRIVLIAGEVNGRERMSAYTYRQNPAFRESMDLVEASLSKLTVTMRSRILSIRGLYDPTVAARDSIIKGAHNRVVATSGHVVTIATQITLGAPSFLRFIKLPIDK